MDNILQFLPLLDQDISIGIRVLLKPRDLLIDHLKVSVIICRKEKFYLMNHVSILGDKLATQTLLVTQLISEGTGIAQKHVLGLQLVMR